MKLLTFLPKDRLRNNFNSFITFLDKNILHIMVCINNLEKIGAHPVVFGLAQYSWSVAFAMNARFWIPRYVKDWKPWYLLVYTVWSVNRLSRLQLKLFYLLFVRPRSKKQPKGSVCYFVVVLKLRGFGRGWDRFSQMEKCRNISSAQCQARSRKGCAILFSAFRRKLWRLFPARCSKAKGRRKMAHQSMGLGSYNGIVNSWVDCSLEGFTYR